VKEEVQPQDRVVVSGKDTQETKYASLKSFAEAKLPDNVLECCKNFKNPSPIQAHAWPFLFDGRDFIGIAKTGSGRFCGFILCVLKCDFVVHPLIIYFMC
jgi:ATP-dependent RNA helicase DBP3